MYTTYY